MRSLDGKDASLELRTGPIQRLAEIGALCNDAKVVYDEVRFVFLIVGFATDKYFAGQEDL